MAVVRFAVNAVALLLAVLLVPDIEVTWSEDAGGIVLSIAGLAVVFGLVNSGIRPLARLVSLPLSVATLGMFSVILNAMLLLGVAFLTDLVLDPLIVIGGFPPDLGIPAIAAAAAGAFIISLVSTFLRLLIPET
jgi:putative membrane protein